MIAFKILFSIFFLGLTIAGLTMVLSFIDDKRAEIWYKISTISWMTLFIGLIASIITSIWFLK